jgi:hypothetical protein
MIIIRNIAYFLIALFGTGWIINFIMVSLYCYREEKIYKEWKAEADKIKSQPVAMPFITGRLKNLEDKYQPKISELERKRQFMRDVMPIIKK